LKPSDIISKTKRWEGSNGGTAVLKRLSDVTCLEIKRSL